MNAEADVEAIVTLLSTEEGGRRSPARSGYTPSHAVLPDYLTSGRQLYIEREFLAPGESARAYISFVSPEHYPRCLWPGKTIRVQEGGHLVGYARIVQVFNEKLLGSEPQ